MANGDYTPGKTVVVRFNTHKADGTPTTLSGTPIVSVYKNSTTETTTGVTLTVDYDSRTGLNHVAIDTSADGTFYAAGNDFDVIITTGTVDSISVVGTVVGGFSLSNRSAIRPTVADRTLDVSSGGEAGIDFANIGSPTTTVNLSGTTIKAVTDAVLLSSGTGTGQVSLSSGTVTVGTNNDKTGYSLTQSFPGNFSSLAITAGGAVTVGTNNDKTGYTVSTVSDKTGYSLTQSFPTNFASLSIDGSGYVVVATNNDKTGYTVSTVSDKTGYSLASNGLDSISTTAPSGVAANFREMIVQTWRRFFKKSATTLSQTTTYADDGVTVITTQSITDNGTTTTRNAAS